jgi:hypothetical protein
MKRLGGSQPRRALVANANVTFSTERGRASGLGFGAERAWLTPAPAEVPSPQVPGRIPLEAEAGLGAAHAPENKSHHLRANARARARNRVPLRASAPGSRRPEAVHAACWPLGSGYARGRIAAACPAAPSSFARLNRDGDGLRPDPRAGEQKLVKSWGLRARSRTRAKNRVRPRANVAGKRGPENDHDACQPPASGQARSPVASPGTMQAPGQTDAGGTESIRTSWPRRRGAPARAAPRQTKSHQNPALCSPVYARAHLPP